MTVHQSGKMADFTEQRSAIKSCLKLGKNATETFQMMQQTYGENCLSRGRVFEWFKRFKDGRELVEDDTRSGRPVSASNDDQGGLVHKQWIPQGQTVTKDVYLDVLRALRRSIMVKCPERWRKQDFILHHHDAPAHTAIKVTEFLAKHSTPVVPHPPYSPDLAPNDFFLFPQLKHVFKGRRFETLEAVKTACSAGLDSISQNEFRQCMESWKHRFQKCIDSQGKYFEGNNN